MQLKERKKIIILSAARYEIADEKTGKVTNSGCTVRYVMTDDLSPQIDGDVKGHRPAKANLPYHMYEAFGELPAVFEVSLIIAVDAKGGANVKIEDLDFAHMIKVSPVAHSKAGIPAAQ